MGCYLQMNGFDTEIFEMHNLPGGVCTAWKRQGYTFDGCIHWLMGSGPATNLHRMWRELHAVQGRRFVEWDEYLRVRTSGGQTLTIYTDPDRLEQEMLRLAPEDGKLIRRFCQAIRRFSSIDMPVTTEKMGLFERLGYLAALGSARPPLLKTLELHERADLLLAPEKPRPGRGPGRPVRGGGQHARLPRVRPDHDAGLHAQATAAATPSAARWSSPGPSSGATGSWAGASATTRAWSASWWRRTRP